MAENTVTVIGNVTRDPEMRYTPSGQAQTTISLAVNRRWRDQASNDWKEATSYFDVVCWREMADNACETLSKGMRVIATGRLEQRSWETNGEKKSKVEIVADEIGPSLRWASAEVKRNERRTPEGGGNSYGGGASRPVQNEPAGGGQASAPAGGGGGAYDDEEPF